MFVIVFLYLIRERHEVILLEKLLMPLCSKLPSLIALGKHWSGFCSCSFFAFFEMLHKWNHVVLPLCAMASFTKCNAFLDSYCCMKILQCLGLFLHMNIPQHLLKESLSLFNYLGDCKTSTGHICVVYLWAFYCVGVIYVSSYVITILSWILSFCIKSYNQILGLCQLYLVLYYLGYSNSFVIPYKFWTQLVNFYKTHVHTEHTCTYTYIHHTPCWTLIWIVLYL